MELRKRKCDIEMKLVPYGGGWTDVYLNIENDNHYFIISNVIGQQFNDFITLLYHLHPKNIGRELDYLDIEYKLAICKSIGGKYETVEIVDDLTDCPNGTVFHEVPWKASFSWDEEGSGSIWKLERIPNEDENFELTIDIEHHEKSYHYKVDYSEMCYAVARACTEALKKHGFTGYKSATYTQDLNIRELLFLKAFALNCMDALEVTYYEEKGKGETSDFSKEVELLLFDM